MLKSWIVLIIAILITNSVLSLPFKKNTEVRELDCLRSHSRKEHGVKCLSRQLGERLDDGVEPAPGIEQPSDVSAVQRIQRHARDTSDIEEVPPSTSEAREPFIYGPRENPTGEDPSYVPHIIHQPLGGDGGSLVEDGGSAISEGGASILEASTSHSVDFHFPHAEISTQGPLSQKMVTRERQTELKRGQIDGEHLDLFAISLDRSPDKKADTDSHQFKYECTTGDCVRNPNDEEYFGHWGHGEQDTDASGSGFGSGIRPIHDKLTDIADDTTHDSSPLVDDTDHVDKTDNDTNNSHQVTHEQEMVYDTTHDPSLLVDDTDHVDETDTETNNSHQVTQEQELIDTSYKVHEEAVQFPADAPARPIVPPYQVAGGNDSTITNEEEDTSSGDEGDMVMQETLPKEASGEEPEAFVNDVETSSVYSSSSNESTETLHLHKQPDETVDIDDKFRDVAVDSLADASANVHVPPGSHVIGGTDSEHVQGEAEVSSGDEEEGLVQEALPGDTMEFTFTLRIP